ncbi:MAG TPA: archaellin/type IV pilin N-terminal domain-containing protein [Candidatus Thermoplasmatota archaeon]|nr:archaellin/type IV pilin N-terminal domain-containing protein [Candidatus Thermoplasmatota archaeon]
MKANRKFQTGDRAEVGVGTLIVFIAMVLVAAVAAAVLINTSGTLQERAQSTGREATQEVSSNLGLEAVYGNRSATSSSEMEMLAFHVGLAAGAKDLDLGQLIVRYSDGTNVRELSYEATAITAAAGWGTATTKFGLVELRDQDSSFSASAPVMNSGDLVKLLIFDTALDPRTTVSVLLIQEAGASLPADFETPSTYGTDLTLQFR